MIEYNSFTVHYYKPLSQISMTDTNVLIQHFITLLILCLYEILINKITITSYITMFMPLSYNIAYCNNTVAIQCSVSM